MVKDFHILIEVESSNQVFEEMDLLFSGLDQGDMKLGAGQVEDNPRKAGPGPHVQDPALTRKIGEGGEGV